MAAAYRGRLQISKAFWGEDSPSSKIPDGIFLQAGLAVFAFRCFAPQTKTSLRLSNPRGIKQFMPLDTPQKLKPPQRGAKFLRRA